MSQEDIRSLLVDLGGEATLSELSNLASREFPNRTLHRYVKERLEPMEQKGLVTSKNPDGTTIWSLTEKGKNTPLNTNLSDLGHIVDRDTLLKNGIEINNLVGSINLETELNLNTLSGEIDGFEYEPEHYHSGIFYPEDETSVSLLVPGSGSISAAGASTKQELVDSINMFLESLADVGIRTNKSPDDSAIQNIVANFSLDRELDLSAVYEGLGDDQANYNPDEFAGLNYYTSKNATISIFNSGKCVITGAKSYVGILQAKEEVYEELNGIGVDLPD